jgi:hypothetical protein
MKQIILEMLGADMLERMREYRQALMELPDDKIGPMHSHGETDNSRGLRIRAISMAITENESSMRWMKESFKEDSKEYSPLQ